MMVGQILPWVLLASIVAFAAWWIFRPSARSRKTDFRVIMASAVMLVMTGGFIFWQSGFKGPDSSSLPSSTDYNPSNCAPIHACDPVTPEMQGFSDDLHQKLAEIRNMISPECLDDGAGTKFFQEGGIKRCTFGSGEEALHGEIVWIVIQNQWAINSIKIFLRNGDFQNVRSSESADCPCSFDLSDLLVFEYQANWGETKRREQRRNEILMSVNEKVSFKRVIDLPKIISSTCEKRSENWESGELSFKEPHTKKLFGEEFPQPTHQGNMAYVEHKVQLDENCAVSIVKEECSDKFSRKIQDEVIYDYQGGDSNDENGQELKKSFDWAFPLEDWVHETTCDVFIMENFFPAVDHLELFSKIRTSKNYGAFIGRFVQISPAGD